MRIGYYLYLIITSTILWLTILFVGGILAGKDLNSFLAPAAPLIVILPYALYKTRKTVFALSKILLWNTLSFVVMMPISLWIFYEQVKASPHPGAGLAFPIVGLALLMLLGGGAIITFLIGLIGYLIDKKRTK